VSRLHWIAMSGSGRLAIAARPRAEDWLETEIDAWKSSGLELMVSLLEADEVAELGLQREVAVCEQHGIGFTSFPIPDRGLPASRDATIALAQTLAKALADGRSIGIHCRAGIGRSAVIAACVLICRGVDAESALTLVEAARGVRVPDTDEQREWVVGFGKHVKAAT
jgi:protein-tyrosine phosphatase